MLPWIVLGAAVAIVSIVVLGTALVALATCAAAHLADERAEVAVASRPGGARRRGGMAV